jgi:hypothetical protein
MCKGLGIRYIQDDTIDTTAFDFAQAPVSQSPVPIAPQIYAYLYRIFAL